MAEIRTGAPEYEAQMLRHQQLRSLGIMVPVCNTMRRDISKTAEFVVTAMRTWNLTRMRDVITPIFCTYVKLTELNFV
jgi:hypothetical protein